MIGNLEKIRNSNERQRKLHMPTAVEQLVWFIAAVMIVLLCMRFTLALMGANPDSIFADLVYRATEPFVSPFYGLFDQDKYIIKETRLELNTVVAVAAYTLAASIISKFLSALRK